MGNPEETTNKDSADSTSSEATSKETLSDIEEATKDAVAITDDHQSSPSPDGQFDEVDENETRGRSETETLS